MIISRTPYRISLFGGGTDFPEWYLENGGICISFTIDKFSYVLCKKLPPFFDHKYRISMSKIELAKRLEDLTFAPIREAIKIYGPNLLGVEIHHQGDLPARSGLGSSSAFVVGLINVLLRLTEREITIEDLAKNAIEFEQKVLKEIVGSQDQIACAYGGFNSIVFNKDGTWNVEKISIDQDRVEFLNQHMVLVYSGIERISSNISKPLVGRLQEKSTILQRTRILAEASLEILSSDQSEYSRIGELLDESWHLKKILNPLSVTPKLEEMYNFARSKGALGGKVLGAGGGGFLLFFTKPENRRQLIESFSNLVHVPFRISYEGSQAISGWEIN